MVKYACLEIGKNFSSMLQSFPKYFISIEIEISAIVIPMSQGTYLK